MEFIIFFSITRVFYCLALVIFGIVSLGQSLRRLRGNTRVQSRAEAWWQVLRVNCRLKARLDPASSTWILITYGSIQALPLSHRGCPIGSRSLIIFRYSMGSSRVASLLSAPNLIVFQNVVAQLILKTGSDRHIMLGIVSLFNCVRDGIVILVFVLDYILVFNHYVTGGRMTVRTSNLFRLRCILYIIILR